MRVAVNHERVGVYANECTLAVKPAQRSKITRRVLLPRMVYGGVKKGQQLGSIEFMLDGEVLKSVPLYADRDIAAESGELDPLQKILSYFGVYI